MSLVSLKMAGQVLSILEVRSSAGVHSRESVFWRFLVKGAKGILSFFTSLNKPTVFVVFFIIRALFDATPFE